MLVGGADISDLISATFNMWLDGAVIRSATELDKNLVLQAITQKDNLINEDEWQPRKISRTPKRSRGRFGSTLNQNDGIGFKFEYSDSETDSD